MELKRDIYVDLLAWKEAGNHRVLELRGARQVGKTFILDKFARENYKTYGIEVKAGKSEGRTAAQLLADQKVEAVYFLKDDTYGGIAERTITVPIYLVSRVEFDA